MANGLLSPVGQVSFPHLFTPHEFKKGDAPAEAEKARYSVELVFPNPKDPEYIEFKKAIYSFIIADLKGKPVPPNFRYPWRSGAERVNDDGDIIDGFTPDCEFLRFWRYAKHGKIQVVDQQRREITEPQRVYAGSQGRVYCRCFTYKNHGNGPGASLSLEAFQFVGDGEPIGAAPVKATDVFSNVAGGSDDFAALIGGDSGGAGQAGSPPWA